jgi:hypothetical protein
VRLTAPSRPRRRRRTATQAVAVAAAAAEVTPTWRRVYPGQKQCIRCGEWFTPKGAEKTCPKCRPAHQRDSHNKANRKYKRTNREDINAKARSDYAENLEPFKRRTKKYLANPKNREKKNARKRQRRAELRGPRKIIPCDRPGCPNKFEERGLKRFCSRACFSKVWTDDNRREIYDRSNASRRKPAHRAKEKIRRDKIRGKLADKARDAYHVKHPNARYYKPKSGDAPSTSP